MRDSPLISPGGSSYVLCQRQSAVPRHHAHHMPISQTVCRKAQSTHEQNTLDVEFIPTSCSAVNTTEFNGIIYLFFCIWHGTSLDQTWHLITRLATLDFVLFCFSLFVFRNSNGYWLQFNSFWWMDRYCTSTINIVWLMSVVGQQIKPTGATFIVWNIGIYLP